MSLIKPRIEAPFLSPIDAAEPAETAHGELPPSNPMQQPSVELHIEELVLHGFQRSQSHAIAQALQQALARLLIEKGLPAPLAQSADVARIDAGSFSLGENPAPANIGAQVAAVVYGGWKR